MPTAADILTQVAYTFPNVEETEALAYLQEVHDELCFDFKLDKSTVTNTSLVADTRAYAYPAGTARIYQVRYVRSATEGDFRVLVETSEDELDGRQANWRGLSSGEPTQFFADTGQINLVPAPDTSTSGSYPQLSYEISSYETLSTGTNMPTGLTSYQAWVEGVKVKIAVSYKDDRLGIFDQLYSAARKRLGTQVNNLPARYQPVFRPAFSGGSRKV